MLTLFPLFHLCAPHTRDDCRQMSGWPCTHPKIFFFFFFFFFGKWAGLYKGLQVIFPCFLYAALNSIEHRLSIKLASVCLLRVLSFTVLPNPKHLILRVPFWMFRLIDFVMCLVQSPLTVRTPWDIITSLMPLWRWESPSVTRVLTPRGDSPSISSFPRSLPRWYSAFPIAWSAGKFILQSGLCLTMPFSGKQLQILVRVWKAMGIRSSPGSLTKQGAQAWVPGWKNDLPLIGLLYATSDCATMLVEPRPLSSMTSFTSFLFLASSFSAITMNASFTLLAFLCMPDSLGHGVSIEARTSRTAEFPNVCFVRTTWSWVLILAPLLPLPWRSTSW